MTSSGVGCSVPLSDLLASGVLRASRELDLDVPGDVAVIGFDDSEIAEPLVLTTVRQPLEESGEIAAETLVAELTKSGTTVRNTSLGLTLIERQTA